MCTNFCSCTFIFLALLFPFLQISNESVVLLTDIMQQANWTLFYILFFAFFLYLHHTNCPTFLYRTKGGKSLIFVFGNCLINVIAVCAECDAFHRILWMIFCAFKLCKRWAFDTHHFLEICSLFKQLFWIALNRIKIRKVKRGFVLVPTKNYRKILSKWASKISLESQTFIKKEFKILVRSQATNTFATPLCLN